MDSLTDKVALITGAAKRIGGATALALARQGVNVVLHYHTSAQEAEQVARAARDAGVKAWILSADLAQPAEAENLVDRVLESAGALDFVVNNAAIFPEGRLADLCRDSLRESIDINALAPFLIARRFAARGQKGVVVNFLDARVVDHDSGHAAYHLSKRLLFSLTRMMAVEFAPLVRVNAVAPGLILPPTGHSIEYLERLASTNPLNRHGDVDDVTEAVLFLLRSDFVTGQVIFVDGGRHLKGNRYGV